MYFCKLKKKFSFLTQWRWLTPAFFRYSYLTPKEINSQAQSLNKSKGMTDT